MPDSAAPRHGGVGRASAVGPPSGVGVSVGEGTEGRAGALSPPPCVAVHAVLCVTGREELVPAISIVFLIPFSFLARGNGLATERTEPGHPDGDMSLSSPRPCKMTRHGTTVTQYRTQYAPPAAAPSAAKPVSTSPIYPPLHHHHRRRIDANQSQLPLPQSHLANSPLRPPSQSFSRTLSAASSFGGSPVPRGKPFFLSPRWSWPSSFSSFCVFIRSLPYCRF